MTTKQAILITAYKNFNQLIELINFFDGNSFAVYIHIDKKSKIDKETREQIISLPNVKLLSTRYKVNWGGLNHLRSYLHLANEALKNSEIRYFHLITGQDYPVKSITYFKKFLKDSEINGCDYIEYFEMPAKCWLNGGMDRVEYFNFFDLFNAKIHFRWLNLLLSLQKFMKYKRPLSDTLPKLYGGSTYWSLSRETLGYVVNYTKQNKSLIRRLRFTFCPEEIYFQTVIMGSHYSKKVLNDNLRYIDWRSNRGGMPAILDESDFEKIIFSNKLFARKFDDRSNLLIKKLRKQISDNTTLFE